MCFGMAEPIAKRRKIIIDVCAKPRGEAVCPPHGCILRGVCTRCREAVEDLTACTRFEYIDQDFWIAGWKADMIRKSNTAKLLQHEKLVLILDLDHTLLHSWPIPKVAKKEGHLLSMASRSKDAADIMTSSLFRVDGVGMMTKLRPFVRTFLREARTMFEMYVYTMGSRAYAIEMAKLLDPEGDIFRGRVIAREDCSMPHQKGLDVVLHEERAVVILDDTAEVWGNHAQNLIPMYRYDFFGSKHGRQRHGHNVDHGKPSSDQFMKHDESEENGALASMLGVLKQLHCCMFFDAGHDSQLSSRDTRDVLRKILEPGRSKIQKSNSSLICRLRLPAPTEPKKRLICRLKLPSTMQQSIVHQPFGMQIQNCNSPELQAT